MSVLNDLSVRENINLDECIVFTKDNGDSLAVNIKYVSIKQRQDKLMGVNFSLLPKQVKQLEEFFSNVNVGELFYYDISPSSTASQKSCAQFFCASITKSINLTLPSLNLNNL